MRLARLRFWTLARTIAGGIAAILASWSITAYAEPRNDGIRAWIAGLYPAADPRPVPGGGTALVYRSTAPPTLTAALIDDMRPADDERYTPAGILLRYERDIVAVLPRDGLDARSSDILVESEGVGRRHFAQLIGDAWGPRYGLQDDLPPSAMPVPDAADSADLHNLLGEAAFTQRLRGTRVCYGWDVEIRSGRRKGRWSGSSLPSNAPHTSTALCDGYVALLGWIEPRAGRSGTGSPGDYELTLHDTLDPHLLKGALGRVRVGPGEVIVGSNDGAERVGDARRQGRARGSPGHAAARRGERLPPPGPARRASPRRSEPARARRALGLRARSGERR